MNDFQIAQTEQDHQPARDDVDRGLILAEKRAERSRKQPEQAEHHGKSEHERRRPREYAMLFVGAARKV